MLAQSNALNIPLANKSVQCCITSPPYWGLRDYQTSTWEGGSKNCSHEIGRFKYAVSDKQKSNSGSAGHQAHDVCKDCGAVRIDSQLGLEQTPDEYVENMVLVFREVRRVLRDDGSLFLNIGDTRTPDRQWLGIPHKLCFALVEDGWRFEDEIVWHKPNAMPSSADNRTTRAHEMVFVMNKSRNAYYDADAIRETQYPASLKRLERGWNGDGMRGFPGGPQNHMQRYFGKTPDEIAVLPGRNKRSVWTVNTRGWKGAHFAVFPPELVRPMALAGAPPQCCAVCRAPWVRVVERTRIKESDSKRYTGNSDRNDSEDGRWRSETKITGWEPTCECDGGTQPALVLDPFCGSGTLGEVCRELPGPRRFIGLDLSRDYLLNQAMARSERLTPDKLLENLPLFA